VNRLTKTTLAVAVFGLAVTVLRAEGPGGLLSAAWATAAGVMMLAFMAFVMLAADGGWRPRI
jgi:hypothetical protein